MGNYILLLRSTGLHERQWPWQCYLHLGLEHCGVLLWPSAETSGVSCILMSVLSMWQSANWQLSFKFQRNYSMQWRIQDFPEEGAPTPQGGANIWFRHIFPKTAWNWKNLGPRGGGGRASLMPPLRSATGMKTRMHSSRMRTARSLTVCRSCSIWPGGMRVMYAPHHVPPATHTPCHARPPAMHTPHHAPPLWT